MGPTTQVVAVQERHQQQRILIFHEQTVWMTQHGNINDFVPSWERQSDLDATPLAIEVLEVTDTE